MNAKRIFASFSSVTRVPWAREAGGGGNIVALAAPPPTKAADFEVKNKRKSAEEAKAKHLLLSVSKAIERV